MLAAICKIKATRKLRNLIEVIVLQMLQLWGCCDHNFDVFFFTSLSLKGSVVYEREVMRNNERDFSNMPPSRFDMLSSIFAADYFFFARAFSVFIYFNKISHSICYKFFILQFLTKLNLYVLFKVSMQDDSKRIW